MKKSFLVLAMFTSTVLTAQAEVNPTKPQTTVQQESEISRVRHDLKEEGYTTEMMNDLFGEENRFFPTTAEKLESSVLMVDQLVQTGEYSTYEKNVLIFLAFDAHQKFTKNEDSPNLTAAK